MQIRANMPLWASHTLDGGGENATKQLIRIAEIKLPINGPADRNLLLGALEVVRATGG